MLERWLLKSLWYKAMVILVVDEISRVEPMVIMTNGVEVINDNVALVWPHLMLKRCDEHI